MKKYLVWILTLAVIFCVTLLVACSSRSASTGMEENPALLEPPGEYASLVNPLQGSSSAAEAGAEIYQLNCASCHGAKGKGDGPAANSLNPKPKPIADEPGLSDGYLYWRIADGGASPAFKSAMPAWKSFLSEEQIWQVVTYLRQLMK